MATTTRLSGSTTIATWLGDPNGGPILRELLAQGGQSADALAPIQGLPIDNLVAMSRGAFTQDMLDDLVAHAGSGEAPDTDGATEAIDPPVALRTWTERINAGRFDGKTVIVTGAGSGIGRATASRIAREGGRVIAVDVSQERLDDLIAALPDAQITALVADITDDEAIAGILEAAGDVIDGLANIAGIMDDMTPVGDMGDAVWERVFRVNVDGTMKLMRAVIPTMLAQGGGSIVNTASEAALRGSAAGAAYTASKHAVVGLTKSTAFMYGPSGLRVNAVAPGATITNIQATFASPLGAERVRTAMAVLPTPVEADALAASITFLLSDDGVNVNGVTLASDGGWSAA
ncbi:SDR family NAD(P)-dependent oxidoreductase [Microbacterium sp. P05]|uniref:SDR family NAD(P)-dependent oxidoreductase n=1 Tax=Microbacterium sp. P05 TaxID=3366948 RepID=UPI003744DB17